MIRYNGSFDESDNSTMPCSSMTYDNSLFQETIVQVRKFYITINMIREAAKNWYFFNGPATKATKYFPDFF